MQLLRKLHFQLQNHMATSAVFIFPDLYKWHEGFIKRLGTIYSTDIKDTAKEQEVTSTLHFSLWDSRSLVGWICWLCVRLTAHFGCPCNGTGHLPLGFAVSVCALSTQLVYERQCDFNMAHTVNAVRRRERTVNRYSFFCAKTQATLRALRNIIKTEKIAVQTVF